MNSIYFDDNWSILQVNHFCDTNSKDNHDRQCNVLSISLIVMYNTGIAWIVFISMITGVSSMKTISVLQTLRITMTDSVMCYSLTLFSCTLLE